MTPARHPRHQPQTRARACRGGTIAGLLAATAFLGLGAVGIWWLTGNRGAAVVDTRRVIQAEQRELLDAVNASGRVEPLARVAVMSRASGIIKQILVEEGDKVSTGQVLAELDREQLQVQLTQDRADLASADARLAGAQARLEEAGVLLDDPALEFAQREATRLEELFLSGDVSQRERDEAAQALAEVDFRLAQVRASLPVLQATVAEARANQDSARAAVERGETAMREATVRCPMNGVVLVRDKEVGDGVSSILTAGGNATQLMTLGDLSEMFVEARVDEVDLGRIRVGMEAVITVDAHRGRPLKGRVQRIAPAGSVDGNGIVTFEVRVTVEDPDGLLKPDMTADAKLVVARQSQAVTLPHSALTRTPDGWTVQRVLGEGETTSTEIVVVELGLSDGLVTEVKGLQPGDRVLLPDAGRPGQGRP